MTDCKSDDLKPLITEELLMEWGACEEGLSGFIELFPDGAHLPEAVEGLMKVKTEWAKWLFDKCRYVGVYQKYTSNGWGNTGHNNPGNWNTGDRNTGYFNTVTPETILVFNSPCNINAWEQADKPKFIVFHVDPDLGYKESWKKAWENASKKDRELVKLLPNFNADVFEEITGIRV